MAKKDIYKIDNYFITIGCVFFFIGLISILVDPRTYNDVSIRTGITYTFENLNGRSLDQVRTQTGAEEVTLNEFPMIRTAMALNGFVLLIIGISYRREENKIIKIWNAIERTGEAKVNDLSVSLGIDRAFILKHLKDINGQQDAYYVYDSAVDKIVDGKLMTEFLVIDDCKNCGSKVDAKISLDQSTLPKCKYCGSPISSPEDLNKLKKDILTARPVATPDKKEFSVGIFILLLVFFWPGAIFYAVKMKS